MYNGGLCLSFQTEIFGNFRRVSYFATFIKDLDCIRKFEVMQTNMVILLWLCGFYTS